MDLFSIELVVLHSGIAFSIEDTYDTALEFGKKKIQGILGSSIQ